jgi:hypothetical protein
MPEVPDPFTSNDDASIEPASRIRWRTFTYRTVAAWFIVIVVLALVILFLFYPQWWTNLSDRLSGGQRNAGTPAANPAGQARFTNIDGSVRIRKANQAQWGQANVSASLEEGDTVQTLGDGMARIAFPDGALYVVKPDTLIVIQQSASQNHAMAANVAVQVTSGVVDLSTPVVGGDSRVLFADAEARIHKESRALVTNNPQTNVHQIMLSKGGAKIQRRGEQVDLAQYEQVSFAGPDSPMVKAKFLAPPILLTPANQAPVVLAGSQSTEVEFTWSAVPGADLYRLRISSSPIFSSLLTDRRLQSTSFRLPSFKAGDYYWSVSSVGPGQKESQASDANKFSVLQQSGREELLLLVDKYVQHGKVIEIIGRTEPGATVLVNNEPVFDVLPNGSFKHFTAPLPNTGPNQIAITAQNSKGKIATLRKTITIQ